MYKSTEERLMVILEAQVVPCEWTIGCVCGNGRN